MLFQSDDQIARYLELAKEAGEIADPVEVARRAIQIDEEFGPPWLLLGKTLAAAGRLDEAEDALWRALQLAPCNPACYLALRLITAVRAPDPAMAWHLGMMALRSRSALNEVPEDVTEAFKPLLGQLEGFDFDDPYEYAEWAEEAEKDLPEGVPVDPPQRLKAYDLLTTFLSEAAVGIAPSVISEIRDSAPRCMPVFHAALRETASFPLRLESEAACLVTALLGEMAGAEVAGDLLSLTNLTIPMTFAHGNWAVWRMGQRLPAEMLAAIVANTPGASVSLRCAFAEHLGSLPKGIDAEAALRGLLLDLPPHDDAGGLLLAVSDALGRRGHRGASRTVYRENLAALPAATRRWVEATVRKGSFVPQIIDQELVDLTFEEVCIERILVDDDDDFDEPDSGEAVDDAPAVKPGRNDPCWCGSGKKYKKCHLANEQPPAMAVRERLMLDVLDGAKKWQTVADGDMARELYFGPYGLDDVPEEQALGFFQWLVCDFRSRSSGKTLVEEFLRRRGFELTAEQRQLLEAWRDSRFGLYETQSVEPGTGVELKDYFGGEPFFVKDVSSSNTLVKWDCILTRVETVGGSTYFTGDGLLVPRAVLPEVEELIEKQRLPDQTPSEFIRSASHRLSRELRDMCEDRPAMPKLANSDGEPLEFSTAFYEVRDEVALLAALRSLDALDENEKGRGFAWVGQAGLGASTALGRIEIKDGKLKLECNSRQRLIRGKKLVEESAGTSVRYLRDEFETMASARARFKDKPSEDKDDAIDPEIEREIVGRMQAEHYRTWPDVPLPALDGITPRAAVATEAGRKKVQDLIRMFENGEARNLQQGRPTFDFSALRKELGLD